MNRRTFTRTIGTLAGLTTFGVGAAAGHSPGESDDENAGNACHSGGKGNKDQNDQGDARDSEGESKNPECSE